MEVQHEQDLAHSICSMDIGTSPYEGVQDHRSSEEGSPSTGTPSIKNQASIESILGHPGENVLPNIDSNSSSSRNIFANGTGATIIPIRPSKDGGLEVLCGQNLVVNYLKSLAGQPRTIMNFPGEFRFLGALRKPIDVTPLDTAVRGLTSAGWHNAQRYIRSYVAERETLDRAALQTMLYKVTGPGTKTGGWHKVFHFVCAIDQDVADSFASTLNQLLEAQQAYCNAHGEQLFSIPVVERAPLCPIFHRVSWWRIEDILERLQWDFVNDFQRTEFAAHGLERRASTNSHMEVLKRLRSLTIEAVFERTLRRERKVLDMNMRELLNSKYCDLQVCAPGFDKLQLLSFNLNVLPFGVALLHFGGKQYNLVRLQKFIDHVREGLLESPEPASTRSCKRPDDLKAVQGSIRSIERTRRRNSHLGFLSSPSKKDRHNRVARALDVIALQELFASPFVPGFCLQTYAVRELGKLGYTAVTGDHPSTWDLLRRGKWTDSGLVIFSRLPVVASKTLRFTAGASLDAGACKGAIWARLRLARGKFLDVFNCHLQASHTGVNSEVFERIRRSQMDELCDFIRLSGSEHPFVLTGDFNVDAIPEPQDPVGTYGISFRPPRLESEAYQRMMQSLVTTGRLVDLLCGPTDEDPLGGAATSSERRHPCTRPPRLKLPGSARFVAKHKYPQRLDYIFYRPTLPSLIEHSHTHIECFEVRGCPQFEHLSDHYGIRTQFRLRCGFAWRDSNQEFTSEIETAPPPKTNFGSACCQARALGCGLCLLAIVCAKLNVSAVRWGRSLLHKFATALHLPISFADPQFAVNHHDTKFEVMMLAATGVLVVFLGLVSFVAKRRSAKPQNMGESQSTYKHTEARKEICQCDPADVPPLMAGGTGTNQCFHPVAMSPYDSFTHAMEDFGGRRCIGRRKVCADGTLEDYVWLTYLEAQHEVLRISSGLHRKYGLKRNTRVGLLGDASAEWLLCDLALMRCGVDTVALTAPSDQSPQAHVKDLELLLCSPEWLESFIEPERGEGERNGQVKMCPIVTFKPVPPRLAAQAENRGLQVLDLELVALYGEAAGWVPYVGFGAWEVFTTMYRSHTGARSDLQSVSVSLRDLARSAHTVAKALNLNKKDVHFSYAWPAFAAERVVLHAVLATGGAIGFFGGERSPQIFEEIRRLGPTFLLGTPSLFRRQISRLRHKHVGLLGRLCFRIHSWALRQQRPRPDEHIDSTGFQHHRWKKYEQSFAAACLVAPLANWLSMPFVHGRAALLGPRTKLRFVLALCTAGSTALPPERCLWMRVMFGCPVLKGLVVVEAGGLVTLGEARYFADSAVDAFVVGNELPGVRIDLLPLELPDNQPMNVCGSHRYGVEHGTMKVCGLNGNEARVGIVCGRHSGELLVFGRLVSLVASSNGQPALCEALEQLLVGLSGPWLMQLLLTAESRGVVGIAVVRLEELWRHVCWRQIGLHHSSLQDLCKNKRVTAFCLSELRKCAKKHGLADWECPRALHLESEPFSLEAGLQTPTFQLRRDQLLPRFEEKIEQLYDLLDVQDSETDCKLHQRSPRIRKRPSFATMSEFDFVG